MTSTIKTPPNNLALPFLAKSKINKVIYLFVSSKMGVIVNTSDCDTTQKNINRVGDFQSSLIDVYETNVWEILPKGTEITIVQ